MHLSSLLFLSFLLSLSLNLFTSPVSYRVFTYSVSPGRGIFRWTCKDTVTCLTENQEEINVTQKTKDCSLLAGSSWHHTQLSACTTIITDYNDIQGGHLNTMHFNGAELNIHIHVDADQGTGPPLRCRCVGCVVEQVNTLKACQVWHVALSPICPLTVIV